MSVESTLRDILRDWMELRMSEISEEYCCAGWLSGLEKRLWLACHDPNDTLYYGQSDVHRKHLDWLRHTSAILGEWPQWNPAPDGPDLIWVPLDVWRELNPVGTEER